MRIRRVLETLGIDLKEFAKNTGISAAKIKRFDQMKELPSLNELALITLHSGINARDFFVDMRVDDENQPINLFDTFSYFKSNDGGIIVNGFFGHAVVECLGGLTKAYPLSFNAAESLLQQLEYLNDEQDHDDGYGRIIQFETLNNLFVRVPQDAFKTITIYSEDDTPTLNLNEISSPYYQVPTDLYKLAYHFDNDEMVDLYDEKVVEQVLAKFENHGSMYSNLVVHHNDNSITRIDVPKVQDLCNFFASTQNGSMRESVYGVTISSDVSDMRKTISLRNILLMEVPLFRLDEYCDYINFDEGFIEHTFSSVCDYIDID